MSKIESKEEALLKLRLKEIQKRLEDRGVVDIKFTYDRSSPNFTRNKVAEDMIHVLEAYLDGKCVELYDLGDSVRLRSG